MKKQCCGKEDWHGWGMGFIVYFQFSTHNASKVKFRVVLCALMSPGCWGGFVGSGKNKDIGENKDHAYFSKFNCLTFLTDAHIYMQR